MQKETVDLLEEQLANDIIMLDRIPIGNEDRGNLVSEIAMLAGKLNELHVKELDFREKMNRLEFERERMNSTNELEAQKNDISWKRILLELSKVTVPVVVSGIFYGIYQWKMIKFEETGRPTSWCSRELHLPRIW